MTHPQTPSPLAQAPVVAEVVRNGFVESVHHGIAVVTAPDGAVEWALGDVAAPMFPRSANKPMQALAMLRAGAPLEGAHLALASASHSGEAFHLEGVQEMLRAAGLGVAALGNTPDYPFDEVERRAWLRAGRGPEALAQNCSGKHAGMLAACVAAGWPLEGYLDPAHPLQAMIREEVERLAGARVEHLAVDGCGAPVMGIPLAGLARAFGRIAAAGEGRERAVADAIRAHPEHLAGTRREVTALIRGVEGVVAKDGAESVLACGLPDGRGIAVKIADGGLRACPVVLAAVLRRLGHDESGGEGVATALAALERQPVEGHGRPVGAVRAVGLR